MEAREAFSKACTEVGAGQAVIMYSDPIVEEIHRYREKCAKKFNNNLKAIFEDIKAKEREGGRKVVNFPARRTRPVEPVAR